MTRRQDDARSAPEPARHAAHPFDPEEMMLALTLRYSRYALTALAGIGFRIVTNEPATEHPAQDAHFWT